MKKGLGRLRGLIALMLAMVIAVGFMPMQNVKAESEEVYYLICCEKSSESGATQFLGKGPSSLSGELYNATYSGYFYYTSGRELVYYNQNNEDNAKGTWKVESGIGLTKVASMKTGQEYIFEVSKDNTKLYFGNWVSNNVGVTYEHALTIKQGTGICSSPIILSAGKYKIEYLTGTTTVAGTDLHNQFSITKLKEEITVSPTSLELTVGDPAKTLTVTPSNAKVTWKSSNDAVAKVSDSGEVTAVAEGTADITATSTDDETNTATCKVTVKKADDNKDSTANTDYKKDDVLKDESGNDTAYVVANADKNNYEAEYKGVASDKKSKKIRILDEIKDANGNVFKVTSIADNALKNAKGKELIIGKNINKIGKKAFKGAKFKKITIRTGKKGKIKIGKNAFKVKNKNCVVKLKGVKGKNKEKLANKILKQATDGVTVK